MYPGDVWKIVLIHPRNARIGDVSRKPHREYDDFEQNFNETLGPEGSLARATTIFPDK